MAIKNGVYDEEIGVLILQWLYNKSMVNGGYTFVQFISRLSGGEQEVLLKKDDGSLLVCTREEWNNLQSKHEMSPEQKANLFMSLFKGRDDICARRYESSNRSGYATVCENEWKYGICEKKEKGVKYCKDCPNRKYSGLTMVRIRDHFKGIDPNGKKAVYGVYPLLDGNVTWFLAIDFDEDTWKQDVSALRKTCHTFDIEPAVEISRSGNGAHVWFFFSQPISAGLARKLGAGLLGWTISHESHTMKLRSFDRFFPAQDELKEGGYGNLIALPFQKEAVKRGCSLFVDDNFQPFPSEEQWYFLARVKKLSEEDVLHVVENIGEEYSGILSKKKKMEVSFPASVEVTLDQGVRITGVDLSESFLFALRRIAIFSNPEYYKRKKARKSTASVPKYIDCSEMFEDGIWLPRGCFAEVKKYLKDNNVSFDVKDERTTGKEIDVSFCGELWEKQVPAANAMLSYDNGILQLATASGKTVIGVYLIAARKVNTLILVKNSQLMKRWKEELERFIEIREELPPQENKRKRKNIPACIGQVSSHINTRGGIVDIVLLPSAGNLRRVKDWVRDYGMVIVDECHHIGAVTYEAVLKEVQAKYVYGFSATPERSDGHDPIVYMQMGPVRYQAKEDFGYRRMFMPRMTNFRSAQDSDFGEMMNHIAENENRNAMIIADTKQLLSEGKSILVLTLRREHAEYLARELKNSADNVILLMGSEKQEELDKKFEFLKTIRNEEKLLIISTGQYAGEGFNVPRLDTLQLVMPVRSRQMIEQYVGRVARKHEAKQTITIYDYVDVRVERLKRMYLERKKWYRKNDFEELIGTPQQVTSTIYTVQNCWNAFLDDVKDAVSSIVIVTRHMQKSSVIELAAYLKKLVACGVKCEIDVDEMSLEDNREEIAFLREKGIKVSLVSTEGKMFAVLDEKIIWYGGIDILDRLSGSIMRAESEEFAGEFLDRARGSGNVQLQMELDG